MDLDDRGFLPPCRFQISLRRLLPGFKAAGHFDDRLGIGLDELALEGGRISGAKTGTSGFPAVKILLSGRLWDGLPIYLLPARLHDAWLGLDFADLYSQVDIIQENPRPRINFGDRKAVFRLVFLFRLRFLDSHLLRVYEVSDLGVHAPVHLGKHLDLSQRLGRFS